MKNKFLTANSFLDIKEINDYFLAEYKKIKDTFEDNPMEIKPVLVQLRKAYARAIKVKRKDMHRTESVASKLRRAKTTLRTVEEYIVKADNVPEVTKGEIIAHVEAVKQNARYKAFYDLDREWREAIEREKISPTGENGKPATVPKPTDAEIELRTQKYAEEELRKTGYTQ